MFSITLLAIPICDFVLFSIENKKKTKLVVFLWNECFIEDVIFIELCYCFFWFKNFSHIFDLTICEEAPEETVLLFLRTFLLPFEHFQSQLCHMWLGVALFATSHSQLARVYDKKENLPSSLFKKKFSPGLVSCDFVIEWIQNSSNLVLSLLDNDLLE